MGLLAGLDVTAALEVDDELDVVLLVDDCELVELVCALPPVWYMFRRFGPPQYSVESPAHNIEHPLVAVTDPALIEFPQ